ncbi:hypothetical protein [Psychrobacillus vulpis]|uniref:hypothetical protein n=1 Tax=Psychrobacillus vulpis TaxID=2325572 RepID=UPI00140AB490|nr:hypothetical protein [Psychrobacillus vulpis]
MKKKFLLIYSMVITFFIVVVPNVLASSPFVIGEEKAGYQHANCKRNNISIKTN